MNLVFQALAILAFILPGLLFRSAYKKAFWNYPLGRLGPMADQIPRSIVHAAWINAAWATIISSAHQFGFRGFRPIDFEALIYWLTNNFGKDQAGFPEAVHSLTVSPGLIFWYFFGLYAFSVGLGWLFHVIIRWSKADRYFSLFRFDNDWYYQFKGEILDFPDYRKQPGSVPKINHCDRAGTIVAAVVDFKDRSCLYLGVFVDFFFDQSGNLDHILLEGVKRRDFARDDNADADRVPYFDELDKLYNVKGHFFILRMSEIKTLNLDYFSTNVIALAEDLDADLEAMQNRLDQKAAVSTQDRQDLIRLRAYELWEKAGRPDDGKVEFWTQAERETGPREVS